MLLESAFNLITAVQKRQRSEIVRILNFLEKFVISDAQNELHSDKQKMVFWVNIYNAFFQLRAKEFSEARAANKHDFFKRKQIDLLGINLGFDDIEHVILRRSQWKPGLGFIANPWVRKDLKDLRVDQLDFRVHFLLNCGAVSCPIIYPLNAHNYVETLENATRGYLEQEVELDSMNRKIILNRLFFFYLGDFGGRKGLKDLLIEHDVIKNNHLHFRFKFTPFNKTLKLDHFIA